MVEIYSNRLLIISQRFFDRLRGWKFVRKKKIGNLDFDAKVGQDFSRSFFEYFEKDREKWNVKCFFKNVDNLSRYMHEGLEKDSGSLSIA